MLRFLAMPVSFDRCIKALLTQHETNTSLKEVFYLKARSPAKAHSQTSRGSPAAGVQANKVNGLRDTPRGLGFERAALRRGIPGSNDSVRYGN
jgi:hypothetical protein